MARVIITQPLQKEIEKQFKQNSKEVYKPMLSLENQPQKGKKITSIGRILLKELKYQSFRFYFLVDGHKLKFLKSDELQDLLVKFVRMSHKNQQQDVINDIKNVLKSTTTSVL